MPRSTRPPLLGALLTLLALLAVVACWLATRDDGGEAPAMAAAPTAPAREQASLASSVTGAGHAAAAGIERTEAPAGEAPPAATAPASGAKIHGTIVVTDASGAEHRACNGALNVEWLVPGPAQGDASAKPAQEVAVTAGRWE